MKYDMPLIPLPHRKQLLTKMPTLLFAFTCIIIGSAAVPQVEYETRAKLLIKQAGGGNSVIHIGFPPSFEDLLMKSTAIMDKSGALKRYIIDSKLLLVTAPPKWGKSTMVDMLRFFLQSENLSRNKPRDKTIVDHQFKDRLRGIAFEYFKRGSIYDKFWRKLHKFEQPPTIASSNDILNRYCGKFPVIYVNFSNANWTGNDYSSMIQDFKIVLSETFKKHEYAIKKLESTLAIRSLTPNQQKVFRRNIATLQRFVNGEENTPVELQCSLQFLSITLRNHYLKYVHVLIDDYDLVFRKYFLENNCSQEEAHKIETFFRLFFKETFTSNPFLEKAFVTGMLPLKIAEDFKRVNGPFHQYFGFTKNEISRLFYTLNITYDLGQNARKWYGGYHTYERLEPTVYNPWSIAHFSNTKEIKNYMRNATDTSFFKSMLKHHRIGSIFESILYNDKLPLLKENLMYDADFLLKLKTIFSGEELEGTKDPTRYVLNYLLALGYLTMDLDYEGVKSLKPLASVKVKVPNLEAFDQVTNVVMDSYTDGWNQTAKNTLKEACSKLSELIGSAEEDADTSSLAATLSHLFQLLVDTEEDPEADFGSVIEQDPYLIHRITFMLAFNARILGNYELEGKTIFKGIYPTDKFRPDFRFYQGTRATVIEVTNGANSTVPPYGYMNGTLKFQERFFKTRVIPIQFVRWIDFRIFPNASVIIETKQVTRNLTSEC